MYFLCLSCSICLKELRIIMLSHVQGGKSRFLCVRLHNNRWCCPLTKRQFVWRRLYLRISDKLRDIFRYSLWVSRIHTVSEEFLDLLQGRAACVLFRSSTRSDSHSRFTVTKTKLYHQTGSYNFRNIRNTYPLNTTEQNTHLQECFGVVFNSCPFVFKLSRYGSLVGTATRYGLGGPGIESRWGEIFRTRPARPWGLPNLLYNGYRVLPGGKAAGAWCWPPTPPSKRRGHERVGLYLYLRSGPSWSVIGRTSNFYF